MNDLIDVNDMTLNEIQKENELKIITGKEKLDKYSLGELALAYGRIEGVVALAKGRILLAARKKFINDVEFGCWLRDNGIDEFTQQTRYRYMQLAKHFSEREMTGMSMSVCAEIAMVMNQDREVGNKAYQYALGRGLTKNEILAKIAEFKGKPVPVAKQKEGATYEGSSVRVQQESFATTPVTTPPRPAPEEPKNSAVEILTVEDKLIYTIKDYDIYEQLRIIERCKEILEEKIINNV
jgi:hypothetical protein